MRRLATDKRGSALVAVIVFTMIVGILAATLMDISMNRYVQSHRMREREYYRLAEAKGRAEVEACLGGRVYPPDGAALCPGWESWKVDLLGNYYGTKRSQAVQTAGRALSLAAYWRPNGALEVAVSGE